MCAYAFNQLKLIFFVAHRQPIKNFCIAGAVPGRIPSIAHSLINLGKLKICSRQFWMIIKKVIFVSYKTTMSIQCAKKQMHTSSSAKNNLSIIALTRNDMLDLLFCEGEWNIRLVEFAVRIRVFSSTPMLLRNKLNISLEDN